MGRALDPVPTGRDGGDRTEGAARATPQAGTPRAAGQRPATGARHPRANGRAGGPGRPRHGGRRSGARRRRVVRRGEGADRRGGAGNRRDRGGGGVRPARPRPCAGDPERRPGGGGFGPGGRGDGRWFPALPAGRGHGVGQDRGLSGGDRAGAAGRSGGADPDPSARDRPDPGPDRADHGTVRRRPGRMAFRRRPAAPPSGVGGGGRRPVQYRGRRPFGPVPALRRSAADRGGRGARQFVQTGRGSGLSRTGSGGGAGADRGGGGGSGLGDAVAGDTVERPGRALRLAEAGRPARGGGHARHRTAGPASAHA
ncbi:hypothetical protein BREV_BREV_01219 [Brevundimonas mediterranea]|uniref:Uncharacterized protein n=1 Tax=Brevundimonas mediterranea TaxID=74329 RepID=A0A7Z9C4Z1_9CAUL|nr:hypothetical protein BREV_BREV_01219 [Brevundimonas mediterranea]